MHPGSKAWNRRKAQLDRQVYDAIYHRGPWPRHRSILVDTGNICAVDESLDAAIFEELAEARAAISVVRARCSLDWLELFFPKRVIDEEVGDALEVIDKIVADPECSKRSLKIFLKVVTTIFWVAVNSVRFARSKFSEKSPD